MWADAEHAYVAANEGEITIRELDPGRYLLTNSEPIDLSRLVPAGLGSHLSDPLLDRWTPCSLPFRRCVKAIRRSNESLTFRMSTAAIVPSVCTPRSNTGLCLLVCWRLASSGPGAAIPHAEGRHASPHTVIFRHCSPADMFHHHRRESSFCTISGGHQLQPSSRPLKQNRAHNRLL